jgi:prephenate dehydratase
MYGLVELAVDIQDEPCNCTRFLILGGRPPAPGPRNKTSIAFVTDHHPGRLHACLGELAKRTINLTRIESRPLRGIPWSYSFFVDFEGHDTEPRVQDALAALSLRTRMLRVLGSYPAAE